MARKPSLADMARKTSSISAAADVPPAEATAVIERQGRAGAQPDGRKGILVRVAPEGWRELRDLAADLTISSGEQVTMQSLILDAINRTLRDNGRPPVA